jgi:hypothetical protein
LQSDLEFGAAWLRQRKLITLLFNQNSQKEIEDLAAALTEQRNPRSQNLEKMSARQLSRTFCRGRKICGGCVTWSNWGP